MSEPQQMEVRTKDNIKSPLFVHTRNKKGFVLYSCVVVASEEDRI